MIEIRPIREEDIPLLEKHMPRDSSKHADRLDRQESNEVTYLIAFKGDIPVGHVLIKWDGTPDEPMASQISDCPDIVDLRVHPDFFRQGIGSQLMAQAEMLVKRKGFRKVGLSVGTDNKPAELMYEKRGYRDAGFGKYIERGSITGKDGKVNSWEEECIYLIKEL